jgi:hypothetical protein
LPILINGQRENLESNAKQTLMEIFD